MDTFVDTTPAIDPEIMEIVEGQSMASLAKQIINLKVQVERAQRNHEFAAGQVRSLVQKISNVEGVIRDYYSENGEVSEELEEVARLLDITLTKEISGTARYEISFTAQVPLDFDADDIEISFDVSCDSYDVEEFDWNEDDHDVSAEEV